MCHLPLTLLLLYLAIVASLKSMDASSSPGAQANSRHCPILGGHHSPSQNGSSSYWQLHSSVSMDSGLVAWMLEAGLYSLFLIWGFEGWGSSYEVQKMGTRFRLQVFELQLCHLQALWAWISQALGLGFIISFQTKRDVIRWGT